MIQHSSSSAALQQCWSDTYCCQRNRQASPAAAAAEIKSTAVTEMVKSSRLRTHSIGCENNQDSSWCAQWLLSLQIRRHTKRELLTWCPCIGNLSRPGCGVGMAHLLPTTEAGRACPTELVARNSKEMAPGGTRGRSNEKSGYVQG